MSVSREEFDQNWNNIFGGILWFHQCGESVVSTERGKDCPKCGKKCIEDKINDTASGSAQ